MINIAEEIMKMHQSMIKMHQSMINSGRIMSQHFPAPPDRGYVGSRCGWYPERPKRRRKIRS
jgi:hypothetical protein